MEIVHYQYMNESAIGEHLKCDYCKHPLIGPVLAPCKHMFCVKCIEKKSKSDQSCPKCSQPIEHLTPIVEPTLSNLLNSLLVKCNKCGKENIPRDTFLEHNENHHLKELCCHQQETINELHSQLTELRNKYRMIGKNRSLNNTETQLDICAFKGALSIHDQRGIAAKFIYDVETKYSHRYSNTSEEPHIALEPIKDYENIALVSFEEAIEPLIPLVPKVKRMAWTVKQRRERPADNLIPDESASIMLYSMEVEPRENCFYRILNKTLRNEDRRKLKPWLLYIRLLVTSLSKLPLMHDQTIYRGAATDLTDQYPVGAMFVWFEFLSCTKSIKVLERFLGKSEIRTLFKIQCDSGKDIRQHSCFQSENEVLLPAASKFQVISNYQESPDLRIVQLKEIASVSSFPLNISCDSCPAKNESLKVTAAMTSETSPNSHLQQVIADSEPRSIITLANKHLIDHDMKIVADQAISGKQCTELDLGSNCITSQGMSIISDALCNSTTIVRLYLSGNQIADNGVRHLALSVKDSTLFVLGLSKNGITDVGAQYLGDMLKGNRRLTVLGLENNEISDRGVELLANALKYNNNLQRLLLAENKMITDSSVNALIDMLQHNRTLKKLDLRTCNLSNAAKTRLRKVAETKRNFQLLD